MDKPLPILAVETTGDLCSVAVLLDEKNYIELNYLQKHIHSQKLVEMIDELIRQVNIPLKEFSSIAISMGPGSFTGLRIGMSAVKGLAFGSNAPIIPVRTFDAFALQISQYLIPGQVFNIITNASIDDCYFAKYKITEKSFEVITPLVLSGKSNLINLIADDEYNFGNVSIKDRLVRNANISALSISRWAYLFGKDLLTFDYDNLEPNYLKQFIGKVKK